MKFLIVGLGNPSPEYENTRHNIGFKVLDALVNASSTSFSVGRYGDVAKMRYRGKSLILIKPSTFMNLSGKAVNYWLQAEKIDREHLLVISDDLALPFGSLRLRAKGGDGGHNGLLHIIQTLGSAHFARLRFGIGAEFSKGRQVEFVLNPWSSEEIELLIERIDKSQEIILSFVANGLSNTMTQFNNK